MIKTPRAVKRSKPILFAGPCTDLFIALIRLPFINNEGKKR
jgi:hypothetical protein